MSAGRWTASGRGSPLDSGAPCASHSGPMSRSDWRSHPARWDHHHGSDLEALLTTSGTDAGILLPRAYGARRYRLSHRRGMFYPMIPTPLHIAQRVIRMAAGLPSSRSGVGGRGAAPPVPAPLPSGSGVGGRGVPPPATPPLPGGGFVQQAHARASPVRTYPAGQTDATSGRVQARGGRGPFETVTMATQHLEERRDRVRAVMPRVTRVFGQEVTRRAGEVNRRASGFGREIDVLAAPARAVLPRVTQIFGHEVTGKVGEVNRRASDIGREIDVLAAPARAVLPEVTRVFGQEVTRRAGKVALGVSDIGREIDVLAAPARAVLPGATRVLGREVGRRLDYCNDSKLTYLFHLHS